MDCLLTLSGNRLSSRMMGIRRLGSCIRLLVRVVLTASMMLEMTWLVKGAVARGKLSVYTLTTGASFILSLISMITFATRRRQIKRLISVHCVPRSKSNHMCMDGKIFPCLFTLVSLSQLLASFVYATAYQGWPRDRLPFHATTLH